MRTGKILGISGPTVSVDLKGLKLYERVFVGHALLTGEVVRLERDRAKIAAYEDLCHRIGHPPAQVALAWILQQPAVTAPIVGPRTLAQLEDAVAATDIRLDAETLAALDRIFPGPGGAAPEAYAW